VTKKYELKDLSTGRTALLEAVSGTIGPDVLNISRLTQDLGIFTFDPGFIATASAESKITYIDGEAGLLLYRGYPVEQLAESSNFLEVAHLLIYGKLPSRVEFDLFRDAVMRHSAVNDQMMQVLRGFHRDAHPMAMVSAMVASMAAFYHETMDIGDAQHRELFAHRIIAKLPTIAAAAYRHTLGQEPIAPRTELGYCESLLHLLFANASGGCAIDPVAVEALELLFILHADHEQNASTSTVRLAGSTRANPFAAISAGIAALWGPTHGGASEAVIEMLESIGSVPRIEQFLARVKNKSDHVRLMGFGHRVYKNCDPRARIIRDMCHRVLTKLGNAHDRLFELALELEEIALHDDYFVSRKLYPNVDFYSGIIYSALGIPRFMFTVMFAIARTAGWVAHWQEMVSDPQMKIGRPRQLYTGPAPQDYRAIETRGLL
jgi:citrate synthase